MIQKLESCGGSWKSPLFGTLKRNGSEEAKHAWATWGCGNRGDSDDLPLTVKPAMLLLNPFASKPSCPSCPLRTKWRVSAGLSVGNKQLIGILWSKTWFECCLASCKDDIRNHTLGISAGPSLPIHRKHNLDWVRMMYSLKQGDRKLSTLNSTVYILYNKHNKPIYTYYIYIYNISAPQFHWCNLLGSNTQTFRYQTPREGLVKMLNLQHGCPLLPAHRDNSAHEQRPWLLLDGIGSANCDVKHWTLQNNNHGKRHLGILQHYCSTKERQNCNRRACRKVRASFWLILLLGPEGKPQIESSRYRGRLPFSTWEVDSPLRIL